MHLVHGLMLAQAQSSHQDDDVQPIGKARQRQRIGCRASVGSLVPCTLRVGTAVARVNQRNHPLQGDHGSPRQRQRLS